MTTGAASPSDPDPEERTDCRCSEIPFRMSPRLRVRAGLCWSSPATHPDPMMDVARQGEAYGRLVL